MSPPQSGTPAAGFARSRWRPAPPERAAKRRASGGPAIWGFSISSPPIAPPPERVKTGLLLIGATVLIALRRDLHARLLIDLRGRTSLNEASVIVVIALRRSWGTLIAPLIAS